MRDLQPSMVIAGANRAMGGNDLTPCCRAAEGIITMIKDPGLRVKPLTP